MQYLKIEVKRRGVLKKHSLAVQLESGLIWITRLTSVATLFPCTINPIEYRFDWTDGKITYMTIEEIKSTCWVTLVPEILKLTDSIDEQNMKVVNNELFVKQ